MQALAVALIQALAVLPKRRSRIEFVQSFSQFSLVVPELRQKGRKEVLPCAVTNDNAALRLGQRCTGWK